MVTTTPKFQVWTREDTRLPCHFKEEPLAAIWVKENSSHQHLQMRKASYFDGNFVSKDERFEMNRNFSLVITDLQMADEGRYHCQMLLENFEVFSNSTFLTVTPRQHDYSGLIIGLVIGVTVALVTLFCLVGKILQKYYPDYLPVKGCGWNPCWRRQHETEQSDAEEELIESTRSIIILYLILDAGR
ncbi:uncharacterized protein [Diadema antillarum]|uniref:uncharacterized protein n=1 Tax=Diadema antillarum TaxID=105358 RepID=UPI003A85D775